MIRFQEAMNFFYKKHFNTSVFFSLFMQIGVVLFSFAKWFQGKKIINKAPDNYLLISDDELLRNKLEEQLQKNVVRTDLESVKDEISQTISANKYTEIIIDNNCIDFKKAIGLLEQFENKALTFKMLPRKSSFVIGSNSSNDRGEVILL
jgi:thiamine pyrophosphokinase